jgi:hypothetical protein
VSMEQSQRPDFYEGQYLGAADLDLLANFARYQVARHALGAHVWGIAIGLELKERPALGGSGMDVFLQPGLAYDGFGREILVREAIAVPAELFEAFTGPPRRVPVWIRHDPQPTHVPPKGFLDCGQGDQFTRIHEGFAIEVGFRTPDARQSKILVAGEYIDAWEGLPSRAATDPLICDGSIPYQSLPNGGPPMQWLVPIGYVRWDPIGRQLIATIEADRRETRRFRRHIGTVAEEIEAADGLIRLRRRATEPLPPPKTLHDTCEQQLLRTGDGEDLLYDAATQRVRVEDLVWVEGHLRVMPGDASDSHLKLFGGRLELRDRLGDDHGVPLWMRRIEENSFAGAAGVRGRDLQLLVGASADGRNRLAVGQVSVAADGTSTVRDRLVVQDNGLVGIGTANPTSVLSRPLTVRSIGNPQDVLGFEKPAGNLAWHVSLNSGGNAGLNFGETNVVDGDGRLFLREGGDVGIGTLQPQAKLDIQNVAVTPMGSPLGNDIWLRVGNGIDDGRLWVEYGPQAAPTLVLSDFDNPPRIQFQQTGDAKDESNPEFHSWIGHGAGRSNDISVMNARFGVGTTAPNRALTVEGNAGTYLNVRAHNGLFEVLVGADGNGGIVSTMTNHDLQLRAGGNHTRMTVKADGKVGIGTNTPNDQLEVRGDIRLGLAGDLFAAAGGEKLRLIAGRVEDNGNRLSGQGFASWSIGNGVYRVTFPPGTFASTPAVVVTLVNALNNDNIATIRNLSANGFDVKTVDVSGGDNPVDQATEFNFVAVGPR